MNILYTIKLKVIPIIDVSIIAVGFVLRVIIGGVCTGLPLSHWIILLTFLLSLFLAFAKRRDDAAIFQNTGVKARKNIGEYTIPFIDLALSITATVTIVCYIMYTVSEEVINKFGSHYVYISAVFVIIGLLRYLWIAIVESKSGSPTRILLKDRFIQSCMLAWFCTFLIIIYFK
jgi:4-hydroxybenzoate polyprenyltransferase